jgi:Ser/Thr protein kinase RdoA (MazF antagonist)
VPWPCLAAPVSTDVAGARYEDLDEDAQVEVLRPVALAAASAYGLDVHRMEPVLHGFNTTFRVDTTDERVLALRVNTNSVSTAENVAAQQAWVHAIARDTDVRVPDAVAAPDGRTVVAVPSAALGRELLCVVNTWLEGPDVGECDAAQAHALGRVMATLHVHARGLELPEGTALPVFDDPLFGDRNVVSGTDLLDGPGRAVVAEALERARAAFAGLAAGEVIPVHADLHGGNLKWHDGRLAVFDFDDSGLASPVVDLGIATFYLRGADPAVEDALHAGYTEVAPLPEGTEHLEAVLASRQLLLANMLLTTTTAQWRGQAVEYLGTTVDRLRHWMATGRFLLDPTRG